VDRRNLLDSGVIRAKEMVVPVGSRPVLAIAVNNEIMARHPALDVRLEVELTAPSDLRSAAQRARPSRPA
jgi:hypothetical protein